MKSLKTLFLAICLMFSALSAFATAQELNEEEISQLRKDLFITLLKGKEEAKIGDCKITFNNGEYTVYIDGKGWMNLLYSETMNRTVTVDDAKGELTITHSGGDDGNGGVTARSFAVLTANPPTSSVFNYVYTRMERLVEKNVGTATKPRIVKQWEVTRILECK